MRTSRFAPAIFARPSVVAASCFLAVALLSPAASQATLLPVGGAVAPAGQALAAGMTQVDGGLPLAFGTGAFSGTLTSTVWTNDSANPFGLDKLTFTYTLTNDAASVNVLHRITVSSFENRMTDVTYVNPGAGVPPTQADRSTGDVIGFNFIDNIGAGPIPPGGASRTLVVRTDSTVYSPSFASVIDGGVSTVATFAPLEAIPEPATCLLAMVGMFGIAAFARRVRR
jgi:hypothetical protein